MQLKVPQGVKTFNLTNATAWFDNDGVLYSVAKQDEPGEMSDEEIKEEMRRFREIIGNRKVCMIAEVRKTGKPPRKEQRELVAKEISSVTKAMAIIITSPLSRMLANIFFAFVPPDYPMKMFSNEAEAKKWIKQYV